MLRRELRWALAATLVLTVAALLTSRDSGVASMAPVPGFQQRAAAVSTAASAPRVLPRQIERPSFLPPDRDLFAVLPPMAPSVAAAALAPPVAPVVLAPPQPPPVTARYLAQMLTPEGERVLYLRDGELAVQARPGLALAGGYVIEALLGHDAALPEGMASAPALGPGAEIVAVQVFHPASGHRELLRLPPPERR